MALAALVAGLGFFQLFDYLINGTEIKSVWKMVFEMMYAFYAIWNGRMVYGIVKGNPVLVEEWLFLWKLCMIFLLPFIIFEDKRSLTESTTRKKDPYPNRQKSLPVKSNSIFWFEEGKALYK